MDLCFAHLIRELKFLAEQNDKVTLNRAQRMLQGLEEMFSVIHQFKSGPNCTGVRDLRQGFKRHAKEFFASVTTLGIEPTNNLPEQALRFIVIDRKISQGTRGSNGQRWCERIWTVLSTCDLQGRSAFGFLCDAVNAFLRGEMAPSLMPQAP
jgi:hypothetical protein